jgi:hypothetical protein
LPANCRHGPTLLALTLGPLTLPNRMRFPLAVFDAVRAAVPASVALGAQVQAPRQYWCGQPRGLSMLFGDTRTIYLNCNSWYLGANIAGKPRMFMPLFGFPACVEKCAEAVQQGCAGFVPG